MGIHYVSIIVYMCRLFPVVYPLIFHLLVKINHHVDTSFRVLCVDVVGIDFASAIRHPVNR
jgi:hypothetical protein